MDRGDIEDVFRSVGDLRVRRMFGGHGIYDGGVIIALVAFDTLFLKSDAEAEPLYIEAGCQPFVYEPAGRRPVRMPYYSCPPEAFDDPEAADHWIAIARAAGHRSKSAGKLGKPSRKTKRSLQEPPPVEPGAEVE